MTNQIPFSFDVPSVSELTQKIKSLLETNFRDILVEGEISNVSQSRNGHYYFTVKDDDAQLSCVIWRSTAMRLDLDLRDGQQVVLGGDLQVYPPHGRYQMIVSLVQQAGVGQLQQKFEELKRKLESEGLFEDAHKKPLPPYPLKIGVITSSTGAAFQDIRSTFEQRWPVATLYLYHASVQGLNAAPEIAAGIDYFSNQEDPVELLIIGRGGGSLEDLWPFNEEIVARAVFNCKVPIISAVGHEVDFSISDFVADARAATPTQAAVIAAPDIRELRFQVDDYARYIEQHLKEKIERNREYVQQLAHSHALLKVQDRITYLKSRIESMRDKMKSQIERVITTQKSDLQNLHHMLEINNPKAPLEKGFTRILQNGEWVRSKSLFSTDNDYAIEWKDGVAEQSADKSS